MPGGTDPIPGMGEGAELIVTNDDDVTVDPTTTLSVGPGLILTNPATDEANVDASITGVDGIVVDLADGVWEIAANILGSGWSDIVVKSTNESLASSTSIQNDDELFFTAASGAWYEFELIAIYSQASFNVGTSIVMDLGEDTVKRGTAMTLLWSTSTLLGAVNSTTTNQTTFSSGFLSDTNQAAFARGIHLGGGGTFRFRWAQSQSNVSPLIVYAGSILRYRRFLN